MQGVVIDFPDIQRVMRNLKAAEDQMPYATALALNEATEKTRSYLIGHTWPSHIKQRNASFMSATLTTKDARATKRQLETEIYENPRMQGRGHLMLHAKGGTRVPHSRAHLAVPSSNVPRLSGGGVAKRLKPKNMPQAFRIKDALYVRDRKGRLKLMYVLKGSTKIPKRVPFFEDYFASMRRELHKAIPKAVQRAMATRR